MASRLELQTLFEDILGSRNVYFQPPEYTKMSYPAIVYSLGNIDISYADDGLYTSINQYTVTFITDDPDSELIGILVALPLCRFDRHYTADNLNHYVYTLYF